MDYSLRPIAPADAGQVLALNNAAVPAVNALTAETLAALLSTCSQAIAVTAAADPARTLGFCIVFAPFADYASENYRWFSARSADFSYVDRIVIAAAARGQGLGELLYAAVFAAAREAGAAEVCCEVNVQPPNPGSLAFHSRLGFAEVGRQATKNATVVVALLAASVAGHAPGASLARSHPVDGRVMRHSPGSRVSTTTAATTPATTTGDHTDNP